MNFRRILARKLAMVIPVMVIVALAIALVAVPAGAINQSAGQPTMSEVLDSPGPVPTMINYQGYLTDDEGDPVNGTLEMTFSIYEDAVGGTALWTETHPSVTVTDGLFNVLLGSLNPIDASYLTGESYLGVQVGADPEMTPRQQMVSVAYAFHAEKANDADSLDAMDSEDFVAVAGDTMTGQLVLPADGLVAGTDQLVLTDGKVGIGTAGPSYKLQVEGDSHSGIYGKGTTYGVFGRSDGGIAGVAAFHGTGNFGRVATGVEGVYGEHSTSNNYGQLGTSSSGVYGRGSTYGVYGIHSNGVNWGQLGTSSTGVSATGSTWGVSGYGATAGVYGRNSSNSNYGQLGTSNYGVYGRGDTFAVYGINDDSGNFGRLGTDNQGVYGYGDTYGVYGYGDTYGVYGYHSDSDNRGHLGTSYCGVYGSHYSSGNYGSIGTSEVGVEGYNNSGNYGRLGTSDEGVYGENTFYGNYGRLGTSTEGVYGYGTGAEYGVYGYNTTGNYGYLASAYNGVYGRSNNASGYGVYGAHTSGNYGQLGTSSYGVYGHNDSGSYGYLGAGSYGVLGDSTYGVAGSGTSRGLWGYSESGTGVFSSGGTWDFYASHNNYGPFTGGHEAKLAASFPEDAGLGLIVSATGESQLRTEEGEISYSSTLPTVQLADTANDKAVFGVLIIEAPLPEDHWYEANEGERFGIVNALGEGRVWVTNINGDIETGDYITTSVIAGYGQKQDDDILHSYTLGKAIETIDWSQVTETVDFDGQAYKIYPIAIVYTSG